MRREWLNGWRAMIELSALTISSKRADARRLSWLRCLAATPLRRQEAGALGS